MKHDARIYIAGHRGLVGSAIVRRLSADGYTNLLTRTHAELDLTDQAAVHGFFAQEKPEYVFVAAAKVGGIKANSAYPAEFIYTNLAIQTNVIHAAWQYRAKKLIFLGSSCIYPRLAPQPMKEEYLLTGALEPTNEPYAVAKIAGIKMCAAYNRQYGTDFICVMPTNLYGPGDSYDLNNSHVIPALLRKFHEAKRTGVADVSVWGTGTALREFMHSDDLADACVFLMEKIHANEIGEFVNIGTGNEVSIKQLSEMIAEIVGYQGKIAFDASMPDGTPRKLLDATLLAKLGWQARINLRSGLEQIYRDFQE